LTQTTWSGADIGALVRAQLEIAGELGPDRAVCSGPEVIVDPQLAVHLSLVFHELCINAAKYGALSSPEGRVTVMWELAKTGAAQELVLNWVESGGPPVTPPAGRGFGTMLIAHGLKHMGARVKLDFPASGVTCEIELPMREGAPPIVRD
jgi:two-component sensor histidine kinase